ncbi:EamA family transporter [Streptomyces sp. NPDC087218]|uniref:EamA family transporter n=1 Tax=Streptomyces sp. NPDC087218 TaxID=3365769 RepID=UPI003816F290
MEATVRWTLVTAIAPVAWGTNYLVTHAYLPPGHPLYGAAIRALPAGVLLLALCRRMPRGAWWWKSLVLGTLNMGSFFALVYLAAQLLPTSIASTVMAAAPLVLMLLAWAVIAERPSGLPLLGGGIGIAGVCLMLFTGIGGLNALGVLASVTAMVTSSLGHVLAKRWSAEVDVLAATSWQLVAGGLVVLPLAVVREGAPPSLDVGAVLGFAYVTVVATAVAFVAWFTGLRHLPAAAVGLVGLLNPVTGVLLGTVVAGETLTPRQTCGLILVLLGIVLGQPAAATAAARLRSRVTGADSRPGTPVGRTGRPGRREPAEPHAGAAERAQCGGLTEVRENPRSRVVGRATCRRTPRP